MFPVKLSSLFCIVVSVYITCLPSRAWGEDCSASNKPTSKIVLKCEAVETKVLENRKGDRIRHVSVASQSAQLRVVISTYRGKADLLYGIATSSGYQWFAVTIKSPDGSRWAYASINFIDISPDGTKILAIEETGRFAIIKVEGKKFTAYSGELPYYLQMDILNIKGKDALREWSAPASFRAFGDGSKALFVMRGIDIESSKWLDKNHFLA